jgi:hypothetical protein
LKFENLNPLENFAGILGLSLKAFERPAEILKWLPLPKGMESWEPLSLSASHRPILQEDEIETIIQAGVTIYIG